MNKQKLIIIVLSVALIISNIIWAVSYFNLDIFCDYQVGFLKARTQLSEQLLSVMPVVSTGKATRKEVITAAKLNGSVNIERETQSLVQVGALTFKFDKYGNFLELLKD